MKLAGSTNLSPKNYRTTEILNPYHEYDCRYQKWQVITMMSNHNQHSRVLIKSNHYQNSSDFLFQLHISKPVLITIVRRGNDFSYDACGNISRNASDCRTSSTAFSSKLLIQGFLRSMNRSLAVPYGFLTKTN